jgi:TolA-binding protein
MSASVGAGRDLRCRQARDALLLGDDTDETRAHRETCPRCQAAAAELQRVRAAFDAGARKGLDDLQRARMQTRLMQQLEREKTRDPARRTRRRQALIAWAAAAAVVIALGVLLVRELQPDHRPAVAARVGPGLAPYLVSGSSLLTVADPGLGEERSVVAVPPGAMLRAALLSGAEEPSWARRLAGRITLVGPARLRVSSRSRRELRLRLEEGVLLAQVTPVSRAGRVVHIATGDVEVRVVGTLFSVEALPEKPTRVAVARGAVDVRVAGGAAARVRKGQAWIRRGASGVVGSLDRALEQLLQHHDRSVAPSAPATCGTVALSGVPEHARAGLGRAELGQTPLVALLPVGSATLTFRAAEHHTTRITVQISAGRVTRLGYTLNRLDRAADLPAPAAPARPTGAPARSRPQSRAVKAAPKEMTPDASTTASGPDAGPPPPTAEDLYREAERALRGGDRGRARSMLGRLVREFPADALTPTARLELARLAYDAKQHGEVRLQVKRLLADPRARAHHDPAHFLLCRVEVRKRRNKEALRCLLRFRRRFPASPHDQEALYVVGRLLASTRGCGAARPALREYLRRYPRGAFVRQVTRLQASCAR